MNRLSSIMRIIIVLTAFAFQSFGQYGDLDPTFNPIVSSNGTIADIAVQNDGKIIIVGTFTSINSTPRKYIARLNSDGTVDTSFDPGIGPSYFVYAVEIQPDGKIIIGGEFQYYRSVLRQYVARLNPDGSLDATFDTQPGASNFITSILLQPDQKIVIGGHFTTYNGIERNGIARILSDGNLDLSFNPGAGASPTSVNTICLQNDGKILIGGGFGYYNNIPQNRLTRINGDGSLDNSFVIGTGANEGGVSSIVLQKDGKIFIGGKFTSYNNEVRKGLAKLESNGTLDTQFDLKQGFNNEVVALIISEGRIFAGGKFTTLQTISRNRIASVNLDGTQDLTFNPGTGIGTASSDQIFCIAAQTDNKILIGGTFTSYNGVPRSGIARINAPTATSIGIAGKQLDFSIYPNPAKDWISISTELENGKVEILTSTGIPLFTATIPGNIMRLPVKNFAPGVYIIKVTDNGSVGIRRLILE